MILDRHCTEIANHIEMKDGTNETRLCLVTVAEFVVVTAFLSISDDTLTYL